MTMALFERKFRQLLRKPRNHKKHEAVPKGCFPVDIAGEGQDAIRYVISVEFLNCVCFKKLLDEYEDEICMHADGPITLPCSVYKFEVAIYQDRISSRIKNRKIASPNTALLL